MRKNFILKVILVMFCSIVYNNSQALAETANSHIVDVKVVRLEPGLLTDFLFLPGETEPLEDVRLAAERGGIVEWVGCKEGQKVKKGQELVRIDLSALKAARDRAKARKKLAEDQLRRRSKLLKSNVLSREEFEMAQNEHVVAKANLAEASIHYEQGIITAPISGIINDVYVDPGEYVGAGDSVLELVDVTKVKINCNVPENDVRFLCKGNLVEISIDAIPDRKWKGKIDFVAWKADVATRTFKARVIVDNKDGAIRPGMIARVIFVRRLLQHALTVPLFTIQDKGGERLVFIVENGVAKAKSVALGVIDGDRIQILSGLQAGDKLIVAGQREVEDGTKVRIR